jgi:hypothetical protein
MFRILCNMAGPLLHFPADHRGSVVPRLDTCPVAARPSSLREQAPITATETITNDYYLDANLQPQGPIEACGGVGQKVVTVGNQ